MMPNPSTSSRRCLFDNHGEAIPALDGFLEYLAEQIADQRIAEIQELAASPGTDEGHKPMGPESVSDSSLKLSEEVIQARPKPSQAALSPVACRVAENSRKGRRITF